MATFWNDLRYSIRSLGKSPSFSIVAILTLGLGVGATTAIFTVANAVVLKPLPFPSSDDLVVVSEVKAGKRLATSAGSFAEWTARSQSFADMAIVQAGSFNVSGEEAPQRVAGARVSASFFRLLKVEAQEGRVFLPQEDQLGNEKVVILSHGLWQRRYGADPGVVGKTLRLDDDPFTVVGIMPKGFGFPYLGKEQEIWAPRVISAAERSPDGLGIRVVRVIGRLSEGVTLARAQEEMNEISRHLEEEFPVTHAGWSSEVVSLYEQTVGDVGRTLAFLLAAVAGLLFIALANVANLVLARHASRMREVAMRTALGAGRGRLARQLVTENTVLALAGGALGLVLSVLVTRLLFRFNPGNIPRLEEVGVDLRVMAFTILLSLLIGMALGLVPVMRMWGLNHIDALKEGGGKATSSQRHQWFRQALLVTETALVLVLLVVAGLIFQGFERLTHVELGFETTDRVSLEISLPQAKYPERHQVQEFFSQVEQRIGQIPGVREVGVSTSIPLAPGALALGFAHENKPVDQSDVPSAGFDVVSAGFFRAAGTPLLQGRMFDRRDQPNTNTALLINKAMARRFWPDDDPLGQQIRILGPEGPVLEVIGIVGDVRHRGLEAEPRPAMYQALSQMVIDWGEMDITVWTESGQVRSLLPALRQAVWQLDPQQAINVRTFEEVTAGSVTRQRFNMVLLALFAGAGLILGVLGVYGVVSYSVGQQARAIGIRRAFGAQGSDIVRWVTFEGMAPVLIGIGLGIGGALFLGQFVESWIYEVSSSDPVTLISLSVLLFVVAFVATLVPARRAIQVDPMAILREE